MSSILEALKKLEDEKAARQSGAGHIAGKVIKSGRRPKRQSKWILPAGMAAVAAVAVLATYILMGGISTRTETAQPAPAVQRQPASGQLPQTSAPTASPVVTPFSPPPAERKRSRPPASLSNPAKQTPTANAVTRMPPDGPTEAGKPVPPTQPAAAPVLPVLKVTGIGWQKDNADRMAMVNGRAVKEGAIVDGARVEEILPDRVRFSINDRNLEIPVGNTYGENQ